MERKNEKSIYRFLGKSGLRVSVMGYGNYLNANSPEEQKNSIECTKAAFEGGVNFFDTAEIYGYGNAEICMGKAFKEMDCERSEIVVSTKLLAIGTAANQIGLSRKHIIEGMRASLKRLQMDYVDIVFAHAPDRKTPLVETCRAFSWLVDKGLTNYWGTSNFPAWMIAEIMAICERFDLHKPIGEQCEYNAITRNTLEKEQIHTFDAYGYGTTVWSPMAGGFLAGKYNDGNFPDGSRYDRDPFSKAGQLQKFIAEGEKSYKKLNDMADLAKDLDCSQAQLALAWVLVNRDVSTCLFGARTPEQVRENLKAMEVAKKWTPEIEEKMEAILQSAPMGEMVFPEFDMGLTRRKVSVNFEFEKEQKTYLLINPPSHVKQP